LSVGIGGSDNFSFSGDEIVGPSITVSIRITIILSSRF
jgi:hypothetical protein